MIGKGQDPNPRATGLSSARLASFGAETSELPIGHGSLVDARRNRTDLVECLPCLRLQVSPVRVIRSAGALGRHHCRPQRMLRRAQCAECRAVVGLFDAPQYLAADAYLRFERG